MERKENGLDDGPLLPGQGHRRAWAKRKEKQAELERKAVALDRLQRYLAARDWADDEPLTVAEIRRILEAK